MNDKNEMINCRESLRKRKKKKKKKGKSPTTYSQFRSTRTKTASINKCTSFA